MLHFWTTFSVSCIENCSDKLLRKIKSPCGRPGFQEFSSFWPSDASAVFGAGPAPLSMSGSAQPPCLWRSVCRMPSTMGLRDHSLFHAQRSGSWLLPAAAAGGSVAGAQSQWVHATLSRQGELVNHTESANSRPPCDCSGPFQFLAVSFVSAVLVASWNCQASLFL